MCKCPEIIVIISVAEPEPVGADHFWLEPEPMKKDRLRLRPPALAVDTILYFLLLNLSPSFYFAYFQYNK